MPRNLFAAVILALVLGAAVAEPLEDLVSFASQGSWVQVVEQGFSLPECYALTYETGL